MLAGAGKIKRVCRATLQCEAYSLQHAAEHGDRIRTALLEMQGKLPMSPHWEEVGAVLCLSDHLTAQVPRQVEDEIVYRTRRPEGEEATTEPAT